ASLLSAERMVSGDRYTFIRNAYLQNREFKVKDGKVEKVSVDGYVITGKR
ncbi:lipoprotein, partial [Pseudomonas syringae pv. japonica str. M301072]